MSGCPENGGFLSPRKGPCKVAEETAGAGLQYHAPWPLLGPSTITQRGDADTEWRDLSQVT